MNLSSKSKRKASKRSILLSEEELSDRRSSSSTDSMTNKQSIVSDSKCQRTVRKSSRRNWKNEFEFLDCQSSASTTDDDWNEKTSPEDSSDSDPAWTPIESQVSSPTLPKLTVIGKTTKRRSSEISKPPELSSTIPEPKSILNDKDDESVPLPVLSKLTELTKLPKKNSKKPRNPPNLNKLESSNEESTLSPPQLIPATEKKTKRSKSKQQSLSQDEQQSNTKTMLSPNVLNEESGGSSSPPTLIKVTTNTKKEKKRSYTNSMPQISKTEIILENSPTVLSTPPVSEHEAAVVKKKRTSTDTIDVSAVEEKSSLVTTSEKNQTTSGPVEAVECSPSFFGIVSHDVSRYLEKGFDSGKFIMLKSDFKTQKTPSIWRIDGKNLLQKYEPISYNEGTAYRNISTYSSWMATNKGLYVPIEVEFSVQSKSETIVTFDPSKVMLPVEEDLMNTLNDEANSMIDTFQIYLQTLISQALDSNFVKEIVKEQDDYFLNSIALIEDHWILPKRNLLKEVIKMKKPFQELLEAHPVVELRCVTSGDKSCDSCGGRNPTRSFEFQPLTYKFDSLDVMESKSTPKVFRLCLSCTDRVLLYHQLFHMRFNLFICCQNKVKQYGECDGPAALTSSLADQNWKSTLHRKVLLVLAETQQVVHNCANACNSV